MWCYDVYDTLMCVATAFPRGRFGSTKDSPNSTKEKEKETPVGRWALKRPRYTRPLGLAIHYIPKMPVKEGNVKTVWKVTTFTSATSNGIQIKDPIVICNAPIFTSAQTLALAAGFVRGKKGAR